ncbi:MAG: CBS domain-containing protein [Rhodospirillales bacterium]
MLKAKDIMTAPVVTATPETTVREIAETLLKRHISAMPVVDEKNQVVGVVSEGDLIRRAEIGTDQRHRSWWLDLFADPAAEAADYAKSHGLRARDVMSRKVITVGPDATLVDIAEILEKHHIKRVPVLENGRLAGIVSRANLLQGLAMSAAKPLEAATADDNAIRERIVAALAREPWASVGTTNVTVAKGVVEFWGTVGSAEEMRASRVLAEGVAGVKSVDDHRGLRPLAGTSGL